MIIKLDELKITYNKSNYLKNKVVLATLMILDQNAGSLSFENNNISISLLGKYSKYKNDFINMFVNHMFKEYNIESIFYNKLKIEQDDFYFMNKYDTLLFDIDDTILSFEKCERKALTLALTYFGVKVTNEMLELYHKINIKYWEKVERKEISRDECLIYRFVEFLPLIHLNTNPNNVEDKYRYFLNNQSFMMKNARKVLNILNKKYRVYAITNGVKKTQELRMKKANIYNLFIKAYISDDIGHQKPSKEYYDIVSNDIPNFNKEKTLIIGDSLTSDMKLGFNNKNDTCWFNFKYKDNKSEVKPTYTITHLLQLIDRMK